MVVNRRESSPERKEKILERLILRAIGGEKDVALYPNESGRGYTGVVWQLLERELVDVPSVLRRVHEILARNRITYGLGVGSTDLFGAVCGRAAGLEVKTENTRVSPEQLIWHEGARKRGITIEIVHSVDEAVAFVERMRRSA